MIGKLYDAFQEEKLFQFYAKVRNNKEPIDWQQAENEQLLNRSLTLFDEIDYLLRQGLLHKVAKWLHSEVWEYVSSEIQYFAANESVWDYIVKRIQEGLDRGFPKDIIPFTGFPELLDNVPSRFRAKPFPRIPEKHRAFFDKLKAVR